MLWLFVMAVSCFMLQSMLSDTVICSTPCIPVSPLCPALPCPALLCSARQLQSNKLVMCIAGACVLSSHPAILMLWLFVMAVSCFMLQSMLSDTVICSTPCIPVFPLCPALPCPALPCPALSCPALLCPALPDSYNATSLLCAGACVLSVHPG